MKKLTNYFLNKNILFKEITEVKPKVLKSRKKIEIYCATSIKKEYFAIFIINAKSRFLIKNAKELLILEGILASYKEHNFKKRVLLINSPLCSKAKAFLRDQKWSVQIDFM